MALKVIGAGLGRTGTKSLKEALELLLGGPCYHMLEVFGRPDDISTLLRVARGQQIDWHEFFDGWEASVDWPTCAWWDQIADAFPDSLILLSTRDSFETWHRSATNTIFHGFAGEEDRDDEWFLMMKAAMADHFTWPLTDTDALREAYHRHNDRVRAEAPADRLLEWQPGDGWEPICERLGVDVPDEPFPHTNTTAEFREHILRDDPAV